MTSGFNQTSPLQLTIEREVKKKKTELRPASKCLDRVKPSCSMSWQPKPKRTSCSLFQDQAEPVELVMVLFSLVNYVSPSGYIPSSRYQNCHFHRFVASLCPVSSQHLPKCLFIGVPHSINCWSSHAKTLLFRDFKKNNLVDDVSMICGEKKDQGWKWTCSKGQKLLEYSSIQSASRRFE